MEITINESEIKEAIGNYAGTILEDKTFEVTLNPARGATPMSASIKIMAKETPVGKCIGTCKDTVAKTPVSEVIGSHAGSEAKTETSLGLETTKPVKRTRRTKAQIEADNATAEAAKEPEPFKEDPQTETAKDPGPVEVSAPVEQTKVESGAANVDSLFNGN